MGNLVTIDQSASGTSDYIQLRPEDAPYTLLLSISGTMTADVEFCLEDPDDSPTAIQHNVLNTLSASASSDLKSPAQGVRINITSYTSGTATLKVLHGGD